MPAGRGTVKVLSVAYEPFGLPPSHRLNNLGHKKLRDGHAANHDGNDDGRGRKTTARRKRP
jgi:hypothetical protein